MTVEIILEMHDASAAHLLVDAEQDMAYFEMHLHIDAFYG